VKSKFAGLNRIVVVVLMMAIIAACSKEAKPSANTASSQPPATGQASPSSSGAEPEKEDGPLTPYEQEVTVTKVGKTSPSILYVEGESVDDNIITRLYKEKLNINYVNKITVEDSKAGERTNLMIASNDLADTLEVNSAGLQKMIEADQIADLTDAYNKYASEDLKRVMEYQNEISFIPARKDGKIYGLPVTNDFANNIAIMYIRQDWLDRLNLKAPTTLDELIAVAKAFVEQDPDNNGKADTYAIAMSNTLGFTLDGIAAALKAYPKIWVKNASNELVYGSVQPEMKEALGVMQQLYALNSFDKEFGIKDDAKVAETVAEGKAGIFFGAFWQPIWPLALTLDNNKDAQWNAYEIPKGADGTIVPKSLPYVYSWMVVRKGFEHPEAIIKSMNLWYEIFHGSLSEWWNDQVPDAYKSIENRHMYALPVFFSEPDKNLKLGLNFIEAVEADDRNVLTTAEGRMKWDDWKSGTTSGWAMHKYLTESELVLSKYKSYQFDEFVGAPTPGMINRNATLDKLELETFTKIIMGASLDTFDSFVTKWHQLGGETIKQEVNDWYRQNQ